MGKHPIEIFLSRISSNPTSANILTAYSDMIRISLPIQDDSPGEAIRTFEDMRTKSAFSEEDRLKLDQAFTTLLIAARHRERAVQSPIKLEALEKEALLW